jgi:hypothetical protein
MKRSPRDLLTICATAGSQWHFMCTLTENRVYQHYCLFLGCTDRRAELGIRRNQAGRCGSRLGCDQRAEARCSTRRARRATVAAGAIMDTSHDTQPGPGPRAVQVGPVNGPARVGPETSRGGRRIDYSPGPTGPCQTSSRRGYQHHSQD